MFGKFLKTKPAPAPSAPASSPSPTPAGKGLKPLPPAIVELRKQVTSKIASPFLDTEYVGPMFDHFVSMAWEYPGSVNGHHREPFGLIVHSLGTALKMLESASSFFKAPPKAMPDWLDKVRVYLFLCGLCHDLGKIEEWKIDTGGYLFDPWMDSLRTYDRPYTFAEKDGDFGYRDSAKTGAGLMMLILAQCKKFRESRDYSPLEISQIIEAICCHHMSTEDGPGDNPYWRALRQADVADIESYEKTQMRQAVAQTAGVVNVPQAEAVEATEEVSSEALEQHIIQAVRTLILEGLKAYDNSFFVAKKEGWLLLVAPLHVCDIKKMRPGIASELAKRVGRAFDETTILKALLEMGLAVQVGSDDSKTYPQLTVESMGSTIDVLRFLPLVAARFFSQEEIDTLPSCRIKNLDAFAEPIFANEDISEFYREYVKGKLKGDYLQAAVKLLAAYDAEPETPSVIPDGIEQEGRDIPLWQHALDIAISSAEGADTGDYPPLLVGALAHDVGKTAAAEQLRKKVGGSHVVTGVSLLGKMLDAKSSARKVVLEIVKNHHGEIKGVVAERIKAAHEAAVGVEPKEECVAVEEEVIEETVAEEFPDGGYTFP